jgi:hypothetical protein
MSAPERRVPGAMLGGICTLALFAIAAVGVLQVWFAPPA